MRRLLIVTTTPFTLRNFLLPFAQYFRSKGWQVDAMAQGVTLDPDCLANFDRVWDMTWSRTPLNPANLLLTPQKVRQIVEKESYDIVHVHTPIAAFVTRYALRSVRKAGKLAVIYTVHGFHRYSRDNPLTNIIFLLLEKLAGSWTDELVVINREDEAAAQLWELVTPGRIHYIPNMGLLDCSSWLLEHTEAAHTVVKQEQRLQSDDLQNVLTLTDELYDEALDTGYMLDDCWSISQI